MYNRHLYGTILWKCLFLLYKLKVKFLKIMFKKLEKALELRKSGDLDANLSFASISLSI